MAVYHTDHDTIIWQYLTCFCQTLLAIIAIVFECSTKLYMNCIERLYACNYLTLYEKREGPKIRFRLGPSTETPIEHPAATSNQVPLFEQLRKNQQEAQDNYDEVTKSMRGTRPFIETPWNKV